MSFVTSNDPELNLAIVSHSNKKRRKYVRKNRQHHDDDGSYYMDMGLAINIYHYYYELEEWVGICNRTRYNLAFKGGVTAVWGDMFVPNDTRWMQGIIHVLTKACDYKMMFGMCPIKIVKKDDVRYATIPSFRTGAFLCKLNPITKQTDVYWIEEDRDEDECIADKNLFVYVWPNHTPAWHSSIFTSDIYKLYSRYLVYKEFERNALSADYNATHPTLFLRRDPERINLNDATEEEVFGDKDMLNGLDGSAVENVRYSRSISSAREVEKQLIRLNAANMGKPEEKIFDDDNVKLAGIKRKPDIVDNFIDLDVYNIAKQVLPETSKDLLEKRTHYEETVCSVMGIPRNYASRTKSGGYKTDAQNEQHFLRTTIDGIRQDAVLFFKSLYNKIYKDDDDDYLTNTLISIDKILEDAQSEATKKYNHFIKTKLREALQKEDRIELVFNEDPFMSSIQIQDVITASERGCISVLEEVNAHRARLGLNQLTADDPIVKEAEKAKKMRQQMEMESMQRAKEGKEDGKKKDKEGDKDDKKEKKKKKEDKKQKKDDSGSK